MVPVAGSLVGGAFPPEDVPGHDDPLFPFGHGLTVQGLH
jgi:hypothetical protein